MDVISALRFYVESIVGDQSIGGMKALLLDSTTTQIFSMVYTQTQLLEKEIYLVEQMGKNHEMMQHLKAVVFVRPSEQNLALLKKEIGSPKFSEYHIFFSNICPSDMITRLGRADDKEVVRQVQEFYADVMAVNEDFYHLGVDRSLILNSPRSPKGISEGVFERNVSGVLSLLLSLKKKPSSVRYTAASDVAGRVAKEVNSRMEKDDIFYFPGNGPMVLILDRRDDPITPLLTQWTYQAMVHELLGLNNNRVSLKGAKGIKKDLEEVVLSCSQDKFFNTNRCANFGDLGEAVKQLLDDYQRKSKMNENIASIEDMQAFLDRYPAFRSHAINVSKHVALMGELARLTEKHNLLELSALEQDIACGSDHGGHMKELMEKLSDNRVQSADKVRLCMLYVLRYESYRDLPRLKLKLHETGMTGSQTKVLDDLLEYAGEARRTPGLFGQGGMMAKMAKAVSSSINGVENVYTQHTPLLSQTLESISKGKLNNAHYPTAGAAGAGKPTEVLIFMVGGTTFEEAAAVSTFNASGAGVRVLLGGSCVHNSMSFTKEISKSFA
jgi:vacuolar protein sorting-associated protein 45